MLSHLGQLSRQKDTKSLIKRQELLNVMVFIRTAARSVPGIRAFSTGRILRHELSYQVWGPENEQAVRDPILFLHGLFGSKQNNRSIGNVMAEDVQEFMQQQKLEKCVLIGHSMGAKAAMAVALRSPERVSALIPVDNAPVNAALKSDFGKYIQGMQQIEEAKVSKQSDADKILQEYEESLPIRYFLLTNLVRSEEDRTMKFRVPLSVLGRSLDDMADFPYSDSDNVQYKGPTLFVRGTKSQYVSGKTVPAIKKFFPNAQIADVDAGHWLISEKPEEFRQAVVKFLGSS
ncbi:uncharacterized protein PFLUO_LOCUS188 [Penicillium psychrofluorescens]|uniref:uncharacterized protein n=1 Tax=Penicillium psychrofluorescens TaxID=3158075 RepID=UPI003CCE2945